MEIITKLTAFATKLEDKGFMSLASDVDGATTTFVKVAKELGGQGYWVQNGRCWAGCYRFKRSSKPKTSAQDIWFECQEEYEKAIAGNGSDWAKYADAEGAVIKTAEAQNFSEVVRSLIASGDDVGSAVFSTIQTRIAENQFDAIDAAETLTNVSDKLSDSNPELSIEAASLSGDLIKEAWGLGGLSNVVAPLTNRMRGLGPNSKSVNLTNITTLLNQLNKTLQGFVKQKQAFEQAVKNSPGIPLELKQTLNKGLRPLSQQSMKDMLTKLKGYTDMMGKQSPANPNIAPNNPRDNPIAPGTPNANAKQNPEKAVPTDPSANGTQHLQNDGTIPLKAEEPQEQHDEKEILNLVRTLTPEAWTNNIAQEARRLIEQAKIMQSTGGNARASFRNLFSLMKTAHTLPRPPRKPKSGMPGAAQNAAPTEMPGATAIQPQATPQSVIVNPQAIAENVGVTPTPPIVQPKRKTPKQPKVQPPTPIAAPPVEQPSTPAAQETEEQPQTGAYTAQSFETDFSQLSPDSKQFVLKHLSPLVQKAKAETAQDAQQSMMSEHMASSKKTLFKLA